MPVPGPIDHATHLALRAAVLQHREAERRRLFPPVLHAGIPGGPSFSHVEAGTRLDSGLRTDVAAALLHRAAGVAPGTGCPGFVWLTRPGALALHDADVVWAAGVSAAAAETGLPASLVVVTRAGWWDPASGVRREWRRLRRQRPGRCA